MWLLFHTSLRHCEHLQRKCVAIHGSARIVASLSQPQDLHCRSMTKGTVPFVTSNAPSPLLERFTILFGINGFREDR